MDIDKMKAGRELDMLVSEMMGGNFRPYSTSIAAAWLVVEKMDERFGFDGHNGFTIVKGNDGLWYVEFPNPNWEDGQADTAPLAICRASLLSVMGGNNETSME